METVTTSMAITMMTTGIEMETGTGTVTAIVIATRCEDGIATIVTAFRPDSPSETGYRPDWKNSWSLAVRFHRGSARNINLVRQNWNGGCRLPRPIAGTL
jgi:hypothetical protein